MRGEDSNNEFTFTTSINNVKNRLIATYVAVSYVTPHGHGHTSDRKGPDCFTIIRAAILYPYIQ